MPLVNENEENADGETFGDIDFSLIPDDDFEIETIFPVESDDDIVLRDTREWVIIYMYRILLFAG